ncbi:MAG: hypothetical protein HY835_09875, partial [Anaerolineae bacterium]|nr:hypothetical protein [Anaerolineae bacterium]
MKRGGLVIGLGGAGLRVAARLRQVLAQEGRGRLPDHIRLLALDQQKPAPGTGKLPQAHHFLIQLPPLEESDASGISQRRAARQALLNDLALGAISSQILRGLAAPLDALRRVGMKEVEVFLVSSTFGSTGSAWLVDVAYLLRHLTYNRMRARIHVVLITPEAFERGFFPSEEQTLVHQATLKELDWLQRARDWGAPLSLYEDRHLGSLPGRLTSRPFHSVQVVDAKDLNTSLDAGAVPAAAEAILCQLDDQTAAVLEEAALLEPAVDAPPFATLGVFTLLYPVRLMMDQTVQRLILSSIESFFPLHKNPDSGRPERLTEPVHLRSDSPYGKLHAWIPEPNRSGILQDVLRESAALQSRVLGDRAALRSEMEQRTPEIWKSVFFQCDGAQDLVPADWSLPEPLDRLGRRHVRVFLQQLVARLNAPDERLGAPLEYLHKLEQALAAYLQDLDTVVENWRQRGEHSEAENLRRALDEARGEMESRRSSLLGRLVPQTSQGAQERFIKARQLHAHYRQREAVVEMVQQTATVMRVLTHRLLTFGQKSLHALALLSDSAFNV